MKKGPAYQGYDGAHTGPVSYSVGNLTGTASTYLSINIDNKAAAHIMLFLLSAK